MTMMSSGCTLPRESVKGFPRSISTKIALGRFEAMLRQVIEEERKKAA